MTFSLKPSTLLAAGLMVLGAILPATAQTPTDV